MSSFFYLIEAFFLSKFGVYAFVLCFLKWLSRLILGCICVLSKVTGQQPDCRNEHDYCG